MVEANRPEAMVEFDYVAQEPDELTIRKGDIIRDIVIQPGGWWEGSLGDRRGMFPDNFVNILVDASQPNASPPVTLRTVSGRQCKVLYSYQPVNEDELQLEVNDIIDVIGEVEEGWWKGKLRDAVGVFPSNFVSEITDGAAETSSSNYKRSSRSLSDGDGHTPPSPGSSQLTESAKASDDAEAPLLPPKPVKEMCRVLFPYEAANKDELTLKEGDVIAIVTKEVADKGWWRGELRGRVGVFPDNFVEIIQEEVSRKPERPPSKSQLSTTNRIRDTITKPSAPNPCKSEPPDVVGSRQSQDEKPLFPPVPGKKPQLPLPMKKPQRLGSKPPHDPPGPDSTDGVATSRLWGVPKGVKEEVPEFDTVERSAMLNHPTASRVKAPRRRPPTKEHSREAETPVGLMNGSMHGLGPEEELMAKSNGPSSRLWENKSKAPWVEELKLNQARKLAPAPDALDIAPHPSNARHSISSEMSIPDLCLKSSASGASKPRKDVGSERSPGAHSNEPPGGTLTKSHSLSSSIVLGSEDTSHVNQNHQGPKTSGKANPHPSVIIPSPNIPLKADSVSGNVSLTSPVATQNHQGATIPSIQYLELMDKIVKLEKSLEQQRATFTQAIKEVTEKLNEERNRRTHLEQELDKLTNLVTQV